MTPQKQRVLRFNLAHYRKGDCSEENCHYFCTKLHAKQAATLHAKHGVLHYNQVYSTEATRMVLASFQQSLGAGWDMTRQDLRVELYVRDLATLRAIAADPEFATFHELEKPYLSSDHVAVSLGLVEVYIEDGKVVNLADDGSSEYAPAYAAFVGASGELGRALE
ncbi:hypothetical protein K4F52_008335 [Lecanicillium sp. MT-2017a]|nr:hypothetical protein K4F52_008335 [Lecanicillium sp. MT-2017a]